VRRSSSGQGFISHLARWGDRRHGRIITGQPGENLPGFPRLFRGFNATTKAEILGNIAANYGITSEEAFAEVTDAEAEHLLDYVTGPARLATSALMQRHGLK
jgi:hypothetical protein